ncbi:13056_t:CDS:2 [Funneliformis geosporum]|nr:13056_t:CDS:2 [Funneliformis geosporum]
MSTTDLESSIKENEESLKEIRELLLLSPEESELKNLATELENLIKIQQEQILQTKKKELLARFGLTEEKNDENGKTFSLRRTSNEYQNPFEYQESVIVTGLFTPNIFAK